MFVFSYERRLRGDLERWARKGWVRADAVEAMVADAASHEAARQSGRLPLMLGILGAVLLTAGVLTFVAANWQDIPRIGRAGLLLAALWGALAAGAALRKSAHAWLSEAAFLLAAGIFGANIMLIAQMYHIEGHYPDALMLWGLGGLLIALLLEAQGALVLALGLLAWWAGAETLDFETHVEWLFLPPWVMGAGLAVWKRWRLGLHAAVLSLLAWVFTVLNFYLDQRVIGMGLALGSTAALGAWMFAGGLALGRSKRNDWLMMGGIFATYGAALAGLAPFLGQLALVRDGFLLVPYREAQALAIALPVAGAAVIFGLWRSVLDRWDALALAAGALAACGLLAGAPGAAWLMAAVVLGLGVWLISAGQKLAAKRLTRLGLALFGAEVLYIYVRAFGGLLNTSLFFLAGGVLFIILAFLFVRLQKRLATKSGKAA